MAGADRDQYYYGREVLHETHPDMVGVLVEDAPELMNDFLDGLIWHSQTVMDGKINVNYYVKDLYGDPEVCQDAWSSPLGILSRSGLPDMFLHPALIMVIELKWQSFASSAFMLIQLLFGLLTVLVVLSQLVWACECGTAYLTLRYVTGAYAILLWLVMTAIIVLQYRTGSTLVLRPFGTGPRRPQLHVPRILTSAWNSMRYLALIFIAVTAMVQGCETDVDCGVGTESPTWDAVLLAVAVALLWIQVRIRVLLMLAAVAIAYCGSACFARCMCLRVCTNWIGIFLVVLAARSHLLGASHATVRLASPRCGGIRCAK